MALNSSFFSALEASIYHQIVMLSHTRTISSHQCIIIILRARRAAQTCRDAARRDSPSIPTPDHAPQEAALKRPQRRVYKRDKPPEPISKVPQTHVTSDFCMPTVAVQEPQQRRRLRLTQDADDQIKSALYREERNNRQDREKREGEKRSENDESTVEILEPGLDRQIARNFAFRCRARQEGLRSSLTHNYTSSRERVF